MINDDLSAMESTGQEQKLGKTKKIIIWAVVIDALLIFTAAFLWYLGVFTTVMVSEQERGPFYLVTKTQKGDYRQTGDTVTAILKSLEADGIQCPRTFGIYYDNPKVVKKEDLRSEAGAVLEEKDLSKLSAIRLKHDIKELPRQKYAVAEFPLKNWLSIFVGIYKVYPRLMEYHTAHGYPHSHAVEIYEISAQRTTYLMPISPQPEKAP